MRHCATAAEIQQLAIHTIQAIDDSGLAMGDFFLERKTERLIVNEINTLWRSPTGVDNEKLAKVIWNYYV